MEDVCSLAVRPQINTAMIAMTILTGACKSTRTATSGLARKPEMLAIAPQELAGTGRNVKRP
jgi:hypothetical protein